ncbi:MAG: FtsX-like permease family protein [Spirochaetes bacterium]|nr:FtsX-like permease family protein [Spirochaetota bacterium]
MKFLLTISLRNLLRQKRRNIFLGSAMAFGVMILITANSFSHGVSDIMFNKLIVYMTGHVGITFNEGTGRRIPIFRDKERILKVIQNNIKKDEIADVDEAIGMFCRAIGNGKADNVVVVGIDMSKQVSEELEKEYMESFNVVEGSYDDLARDDIENPVLLSRQKAESLNVKRNDVIRIRFQNVYGQDMAARAVVVGLMANDNLFMQGVLFVELKNIKKMMGYRPQECGNIQIILKNPVRDAVKTADRLHEALNPGPAFIAGTVRGAAKAGVTILPFMADNDSKRIMRESFKLASGRLDDVLAKDGVMIGRRLAGLIGAYPGSKISISFKPRFADKDASFTCKVNGIFTGPPDEEEKLIYMHESLFYKYFYSNLPDIIKDKDKAYIPPDDSPFSKALGTEWVLLDRTATTDDATKKEAQIAKKKIKAMTMDVNTMYETASDVLKLEGVLNLVTLIAVLILFFIIVLGVINTLRMSIRERTREIGTIRAIGMQKRDVRSIFILETVSLTFFASICGVVLAFIVMELLSLIKFNVVDNPMGILLLNQRLHFLPTISGIIFNILFIILIAAATAYFPSRRAAAMSAADALRHYE